MFCLTLKEHVRAAQRRREKIPLLAWSQIQVNLQSKPSILSTTILKSNEILIPSALSHSYLLTIVIRTTHLPSWPKLVTKTHHLISTKLTKTDCYNRMSIFEINLIICLQILKVNLSGWKIGLTKGARCYTHAYMNKLKLLRLRQDCHFRVELQTLIKMSTGTFVGL